MPAWPWQTGVPSQTMRHAQCRLSRWRAVGQGQITLVAVGLGVPLSSVQVPLDLGLVSANWKKGF